MAEPRAPLYQRPALWLGLFFVLAAVAHLLDLLAGPWHSMHWEELFNARAGVQVACGHLGNTEDMQYRTFCGGCTAQALHSAPLFHALGPTVMTWKVMLSAWHMGILAAGAAVAWRVATPWAAVAWTGLMIGAPGFYRELTHTGWGNHAESAIFPLVTALMLGLADDRGRRSHRAAILLVAGAWTGLGFWYCHTSAWAIPALALGAIIVDRWMWPLFLAGLPAGMWPSYRYYKARPNDADATMDWWSALDLAPPHAIGDWLGGAYLRKSLWAETVFGAGGVWPGVWWAALWVLALLALVRILMQLRWGVLQDRVSALLPVVGLPTLITVYILRYDLWSNLPDIYVNEAFNLRYRAPLIPILSLLAAIAAGWPWKNKSLRVLVIGTAAALGGYGLAQRAELWTGFRPQALDLRLYLHDGWPDRTVPLGTPPQPLRRRQGRDTDLRAALTFLEDHQDPFEDCRLDHLYEAGRRLGLGAADPNRELGGWVEAFAAHTVDPLHRRLFVDGMARALIEEDGSTPHPIAPRLNALDDVSGGLGLAAGRASGRRASRGFQPAADSAVLGSMDPRVWMGVCEGRGRDRVLERTRGGLDRPAADVQAEHHAQKAGECIGHKGYAVGVGYAWGRHVGCRDDDTADLRAELGEEHAHLDAALAGQTEACVRYRGAR